MADFSLIVDDKPEGVTSFRSLSDIKKAHRGEKVGHTGTLDKFASGLMLVLTGGATKLNPLFSFLDKSYRAEIEFGSETDTLDPEGSVIKSSPLPSRESLIASIEHFNGLSYEQVPPVYSAIHVDGKRAYNEARKGKDVDMPKRPVTIYSLALESFDGERCVITAHVSKGTYIRSLARDIALYSNSTAHLTKLRRLTVGPFSLDDVTGLTPSLEASLSLFKRICQGVASLDKQFLFQYQNGNINKKAISFTSDSDGYYILYSEDNPVGIIERKGEAVKTVTFIRV